MSGVSAAHFARSFKEAFGIPPHRYLLTLRIERAKTLLRQTGLSITEVAFRTGWESLGTFGRTFRDVVGESPTEHRSRGRAAAPHGLHQVPACFLSAEFTQEPVDRYGAVDATFRDPSGNGWKMIQARSPH